VDGKPEGRFQDLVLLQAHPQGQEQARDEAGQLARELDAPALDEQVHDREVEGLPAGGTEGFGPRVHDVDAVALAAQHHGKCASAGGVAVDEKDGGHFARLSKQSTYHPPALTTMDLRAAAGASTAV